MKKPSIPKNEKDRLKELDSFDVLDTPPEFSYDQITQLASYICDVPIALVSIIDSERQWFKSHHGLDATETPRDISFCGHAINTDNTFIIENALKDPRFSDNPLVTGDPKVIFYAGAQLKTQNGFNIGTLCVIDHKPREITKRQREALEVLASQVVAQLELRRANYILAQQNQLIKEQDAKFIQAEKLSSMGIFASGMAHEINNPLAIIMSHNQVNEKLLDRGEYQKLRDSFKVIGRTVKRISNIINGLQKISRDESRDDFTLHNLNDILEDSLSIMSGKAKESETKIINNISKEIELLCHPGELSQVLVNLVDNACDAIEDEDKKWIEIRSEEDNENIILSVIDSGSGISHEIVGKIMDPFFTTKEMGKGTGLGLSVSQGLLKSNKAVLEYDYDSDNTKFDIKIPKSLLKQSA